MYFEESHIRKAVFWQNIAVMVEKNRLKASEISLQFKPLARSSNSFSSSSGCHLSPGTGTQHVLGRDPWVASKHIVLELSTR